jgi:hypothetical protein
VCRIGFRSAKGRHVGRDNQSGATVLVPYHGGEAALLHQRTYGANSPTYSPEPLPPVIRYVCTSHRGAIAGRQPRKKAWRETMTTQHSKTKWSADVTEHSDALDLENDVFKRSPTSIAQSLKQSAEHSHRRKSTPYRSAMSMLTFYINRAGKHLSKARKKKLEAAKQKLREAFHRETKA